MFRYLDEVDTLDDVDIDDDVDTELEVDTLKNKNINSGSCAAAYLMIIPEEFLKNMSI